MAPSSTHALHCSLWTLGLIMTLSSCFLRNQVEASQTSDSLGNLTLRFWEWRLQNAPEYGTKYGVQAHEARLEQFTEAAMSQQVKDAKEFLVEAETLAVHDLNEKDIISLDVLKDLLSTFIRGYPYRSYGAYIGLSVFDNPLNEIKSVISWMKLNNEQDYRNALSRYQKFPEYLTQKTELLQIAIDNGTTRFQRSVDIVIKALDKFLNISQPRDTFFYKPFKDLSNIDNGKELQINALSIIGMNITPAVQQYNNYLKDVYRPEARLVGGVGSLPGGREFYRECLRWHLSLDYTPQQIHDMGLREVARINKQIKKLIQDANFEGDVKSYLAYLKSKPENTFSSEEEMLQTFKDTVKEIYKRIPTILDNPLQLNVSILPAASANAPTGRYTEPALDGSRDGIFYANVHNPTKRSRFGLMALTLHEVEPGHHTQMSYIVNENIPNFRRAIEYRKYYAVPFNWPFYTAYVEGWALYAESLGVEMGLYKEDPNSRTSKHLLLGRYTSEILRACRLVVDTGIHEFGWTFAKSQEYMLNYTDLPVSQVEVEVARYVAYPGQATAYKIGEATIIRLREEAEERLGSGFNLREFHSTILRLGPVPLNIMERVVKKWVEREMDNARATTSRATSSLHAAHRAPAAAWTAAAILVVCMHALHGIR